MTNDEITARQRFKKTVAQHRLQDAEDSLRKAMTQLIEAEVPNVLGTPLYYAERAHIYVQTAIKKLND